MHHDWNAPLDAIHDLLGDFFSFVDFEDHSLAVGAQRKETVNSSREIKIDDGVGRRIVDRAIVLESDRHRQQDAFHFLVARHKCSFHADGGDLPYAYRNELKNSTM